MKIALYHPWIYLKSGLERTILEILKKSVHEIGVYTSHYDAEGTYPQLKEYSIEEINPVSVERNYGAVLSAGRSIALTKIDLSNFDALVICCDGLGSFLTIRNNDIPVINLCFTPLRAVYDIEYRKRHFETYSKRRFFASAMEFGYKLVDKWCWHKYQHVISISETVKERILAANLAEINKISVCYPGIDQDNIFASDVYEKYFFIAGRIMWTKNLELGIQAFKRFSDVHDSSFKLIIAGMVDKKSQPYYEKLQELAASHSNIQFVIEPDDDEMQSLYQNCYATLFTAFNEDLGLTPMEAMTKSKAVIAVNRGGPREVVLDQQTGYLVSPDPESFAEAMVKLAKYPDQAKAFGAKGLARVKQFTWQNFVHQFDEILNQHLSSDTMTKK